MENQIQWRDVWDVLGYTTFNLHSDRKPQMGLSLHKDGRQSCPKWDCRMNLCRKKLVGRPHSRWKDNIEKDTFSLLHVWNGIWWHKIELEEENWGGHDPNTGRNAIGEGETGRHRDREYAFLILCTYFSPSLTSSRQLLFDGRPTPTCVFSYSGKVKICICFVGDVVLLWPGNTWDIWRPKLNFVGQWHRTL